MNTSDNIQHLLAQTKQVNTIGAKNLASRGLGQQFKKLMQQGVLSVVLLASMTQAFASPTVPSIPTASPTTIESVAQDHTNRLSEPVLFNPLQSHPQAQRYVQDNGLIDGTSLLKHWRDAGLSNSDIYNLTEILLQTQSPVIASTHADLSHAQKLAQRTSGLFSISSPEEAYNFLDHSNFDSLVEEGLLEDVMHTVSDRDFAADQVEHVEFDVVLDMWNRSSILKAGMLDAPNFVQPSTRAEVDQTLQHLKRSVTETGLSSVRIPLSMWTDAGLLDTVAHDLIQANQELQSITGWQGPVMGLNGRVSLQLGEPYNVAAATTSVTGDTLIIGRLDSFAHEFAHAVEANMAKDLGYASQDYDMPLMHEHQAQDQYHAFWNKSVQTIEKTSYQLDQSWFRTMDEIAQEAQKGPSDTMSAEQSKHLADYLTRPHERFAFAFMSHVASVLPADGVLNHIVPGQSTNGSVKDITSPFAEKSPAQQQNWQDMFSGLNKNWWRFQINSQAGMKTLVADTSSILQDEVSDTSSLSVAGSVYANIGPADLNSSDEVGTSVYANIMDKPVMSSMHPVWEASEEDSLEASVHQEHMPEDQGNGMGYTEKETKIPWITLDQDPNKDLNQKAPDQEDLNQSVSALSPKSLKEKINQQRQKDLDQNMSPGVSASVYMSIK